MFSQIVKSLIGISLVGGPIATASIFFKSSSKQEERKQDIGQVYLDKKFSGCTELLDNKSHQRDYQQIYLCPTGSNNKLEFIYYDKENGTNEISKKINSLKQFTPRNFQYKLIIDVEGLGEKTLDWPSLLFNYTDPSDSKNSLLRPDSDCKISEEGDKLFTCNSIWEVIKKRK